MAYQPYSQTLQALDKVGSTLQTMKALDITRRQATTEGELRMAQLGLQKQQLEGQNRLALLNAELAGQERAENRAERAKQLEISQGHLTLAQEEATERKRRFDEEAAEKRWMNEGGSVEELWRGSMAKQGVPQERIEQTIQSFANSDPYGYAKRILTSPTIRSKMFDVMDNLDEMIHEERLLQRMSGNTQSASEKAHAAIVKDYQTKAAYLTRYGIGPETEMGRSLLAKAQKAGVDLRYEIVDDIRETVDPSGSGETIKTPYKKPVWQAQDFDIDVSNLMTKQKKFDEFANKYPWWRDIDIDRANKIIDESLINPKEEGVIVNTHYGEAFGKEGWKGYRAPSPPAPAASTMPKQQSMTIPATTAPRLATTMATGNYPTGGFGTPADEFRQQLNTITGKAVQPLAGLVGRAIESARIKPMNPDIGLPARQTKPAQTTEQTGLALNRYVPDKETYKIANRVLDIISPRT